MRDTEKLKRVLSRTAQAEDDVGLPDQRACIAQVLDEIDMVVLPRDIVLDNGEGQTLSFTVKSRRLLRVNRDGTRTSENAPIVLNAELTGDEEQMTALAQLIIAFSSDARHVTTSASDVSKTDVLGELGVSGPQLLQALEEAGFSLTKDRIDILQNLVETADENTLTWARLEDGDLAKSSGDAASLKLIHDTALPHIQKTERPKTGHASSWMFGCGTGDRISITIIGNDCVIVKVPQDFLQTWIHACAGHSYD